MHFLSIQRFNAGNETPLYTSPSLISGAPNSSAGKLKFDEDDVTYDNGSISNPLNNNIKIQDAGVYSINFSVTAKANFVDSPENGAWWVQITVNNTEVAQSGVELPCKLKNERHSTFAEVILDLNINDVIDIRVAPEKINTSMTIYAFSINVKQLS